MVKRKLKFKNLTGMKVQENSDDKIEQDEIDEQFFRFVLKAKESGRKFIFLMQDEKKMGAHTAFSGSIYTSSRMLKSACESTEEFKQAFKVAMLEMSVADIDELLKHNNPFKKTEPARAYNTHKL